MGVNMKKLNELENKWVSGGFKKTPAIKTLDIKENGIKTIRHLLKNNKGIKIENIQPIGIMESGKLQLKIAQDIKSRQVILLIGYLMWFYDIKKGDL